MILQGTLDIFATNCESTAWVLLWKTRSRRIGVWVCRVAHFNFFTRAWTMVVFWKENLETPENEGGDETNYPSPPKFTFYDDPDVPFGPVDFQNLLHLQIQEKEWNLEVHRVSGYLCDRHHPSLNLFRCLRMMAMMISHQRKRGNGDGPDRVSECTLMHKCNRNHNINLRILQNLMMYRMRTSQT